MCTCITLKTKDNYFGRNMDIESSFNESVVITPKEYEFSLKNGSTFKTKYAMIGMGTVIQKYPLYAEATNEKGLSMAGLYFPNNAYYFDEKSEKLNLTPFELIPYFLGQYTSVAEIRNEIENLVITNIPFSECIPITDLHWMISDGKECIVLEQMEEGLKVYDNPIGVLTNNPPFSYHLMNMNNYLNLSAHYVENRFSNKIDLHAYGQGMGAMGLPGDVSPASRFIRAAFNTLNSVCDDDEYSSITQFFHILDSVKMVQGSTITNTGKYDVTTYSCCMNTNKGIYYYKTYANSQITAITMKEDTIHKKELSVYPLINKQQIKYDN